VTRAMAVWLLAAALLPGSDLDGVRAEPNLEKRAKAALEYANTAITVSRQAYMDSDYKQAMASLNEVRTAADLALESLNATGKNARRSPKPFKNAEKQINELIRRLNSLETDFGVDDRPAVQQVVQRLSEIHDELIVRIMGKKK
jgi:uncharacterized coiled-coil DUF342 family protein